MFFGVPRDVYFPGLILIASCAVAFVSLLYAFRHWKRGGYLRLVRAITCLALAGLALSDLMDQSLSFDLTYAYYSLLIILLALSFVTALVEL